MLQPQRQQARGWQDLVYWMDFGGHGHILRARPVRRFGLFISNQYKARAKRHPCGSASA
jgi:hypothetical protein